MHFLKALLRSRGHTGVKQIRISNLPQIPLEFLDSIIGADTFFLDLLFFLLFLTSFLLEFLLVKSPLINLSTDSGSTLTNGLLGGLVGLFLFLLLCLSVCLSQFLFFTQRVELVVEQVVEFLVCILRAQQTQRSAAFGQHFDVWACLVVTAVVVC